VGAIAATSAPIGTVVDTTAAARPHPPIGPTFHAGGVSAPAGPTTGAADSLAAASVVSAPTGPAAGVAGPLDVVVVVSAPAGTAADAPAWLSFDLSMGGAPYRLTPHAFFAAPQYGFPVQPAWTSFFDPSMGGAPYWSMSHAFSAAPQYGLPVQQVEPSFMLPLPQQSPPLTSWFGGWDPQSLAGCLSSMASAPPTPVNNWVAESDATNHTTPHFDHIFSPRSPSLAHPSSIVVGNGSVLPVTSVGDSVLPGPFYLNDVLLAPDLVQSLLFVRRFTTDNSYSMEFVLFGLSVKDLATMRATTASPPTWSPWASWRPSQTRLCSSTATAPTLLTYCSTSTTSSSPPQARSFSNVPLQLSSSSSR
jgi:hypothetical protein